MARGGWRFAVDCRDMLAINAGECGKEVRMVAMSPAGTMVGVGRLDASARLLASPWCTSDAVRAIVFHVRAIGSQQQEIVWLGAPPRMVEVEPYSTYAAIERGGSLVIESFFSPVGGASARDIIVAPEQVHAVLEAVLRAQQPQQRKIRDGARRQHAKIVSIA
jgi:hypothetical protein